MMHRYMKYLTQENTITTAEGKVIEVFKLDIQDEPEIFEEWAVQFRRNYCSDDNLQSMVIKMNISAKEYLENYKLPTPSGIGLSTMSGDFGEILISDYLQFIEKYEVPRTRYNGKINKETSTQGSDVLGYKKDSLDSVNDEVIVMEVKSSASDNSNSKAKEKLQEAINHSNKDFERFATSIVASYERLIYAAPKEADFLQRFLNITDQPYQVTYGAVAVHSNQSYDIDVIRNVVTKQHIGNQSLRLLVIHSDGLMNFIKELYLKASEV